jgi:hypothetical protein
VDMMPLYPLSKNNLLLNSVTYVHLHLSIIILLILGLFLGAKRNIYFKSSQ